MNNLKNKKFVAALAVLAVIIIALVIVGLVYSNRGGQSGNTNNAANHWVTYRSEQYGLQFDYLKSWGKPHITSHQASTLGASPGVKVSGIQYLINFSQPPKNVTITINFTSADYSVNACQPGDNNCPNTTALTKESVTSYLESKKPTLKRDSSSYATISYSSTAAALNIYQEVKLTKINVSAANINFVLENPSPKCPADKLAPDSMANCVTNTEYANLGRLSKSLKSL